MHEHTGLRNDKCISVQESKSTVFHDTEWFMIKKEHTGSINGNCSSSGKFKCKDYIITNQLLFQKIMNISFIIQLKSLSGS